MSEKEVGEVLGNTDVPLSLQHLPDMANGETIVHCTTLSTVVHDNRHISEADSIRRCGFTKPFFSLFRKIFIQA